MCKLFPGLDSLFLISALLYRLNFAFVLIRIYKKVYISILCRHIWSGVGTYCKLFRLGEAGNLEIYDRRLAVCDAGYFAVA